MQTIILDIGAFLHAKDPKTQTLRGGITDIMLTRLSPSAPKTEMIEFVVVALVYLADIIKDDIAYLQVLCTPENIETAKRYVFTIQIDTIRVWRN